MYDIAIIGGGIIGTAIARELSRNRLNIILIEKESDVANGTTKANSAIVHAGYDPLPGTLKGILNARGNPMFDRLCQELAVPFKRIGSLVVALNEEELTVLEDLYERGKQNQVPGLKILSGKELRTREPAISKQATSALYAPTAGIVDPYLLAIALAENAVENGVHLKLNSLVTAIEKKTDYYQLQCGDGKIKARYVVNAAGLFSDQIHQMVGGHSYQIISNRGQYWLLDKSAGTVVNHIIFQCPAAHTKGVVILPTVHGNLLVGPNAEEVDSKEALETTADGLEFVRQEAEKITDRIPFDQVITSFAGLRAKTQSGDFIIGESEAAKGFINVAAIDSPGLAASPAIAHYVVELLQQIAGPFQEKSDFRPERKPYIPFIKLPEEKKQQLIEKDPRYGRIVCRCENITEGEIVRAIQGVVGARTVDGVKKRVRAGMGRCQGGFCTSKVMQIIARELNMPMHQVTKDGPGSYILTNPTKLPESPVEARPPDQAANPLQTKTSRSYELVVVGGGPAGMAAAIEAKKSGLSNILVIERERELGGILQQCIHNGFGLHIFKEELTGPEYAERFADEMNRHGIEIKLNTTVLQVRKDKRIVCMSPEDGLITLEAGAVILAMGCRERTRGAVNIPGTRPAGVFTAGTAQRFVNIEGYMVGKKVVVFGSGDIGLIMARRMILEGAEVVAVIERKPYSEGLVRNRVQCLEDYNIPLLLNHTIVEIKGKDRVAGVVLAATDKNKKPIKGSEKELECDTVLFSRGLIPENELSQGAGIQLCPKTGGPVVNESMETSVPGIFACGNVAQVHDLVDRVTMESKRAGRGAARYLLKKRKHPGFTFRTAAGNGIRYVVPHRIRTGYMEETTELIMRANGFYNDVYIGIKADDKTVKRKKTKYLSPGEMIVLKINKGDLPRERFANLLIELEKEQS